MGRGQGNRQLKDARQVIIDLHAYYTTSTVGLIVAGNILEHLSSASLDSSFTKPFVEFINDWDTRQQTYNERCQGTERLGPNVLKQMLMRAVNPIPALRHVKTEEQQMMVRGSPPLSYSQYLALIKSAATTLDSGGRRYRNNLHLIEDATDSQDNEEAIS